MQKNDQPKAGREFLRNFFKMRWGFGCRAMMILLVFGTLVSGALVVVTSNHLDLKIQLVLLILVFQFGSELYYRYRSQRLRYDYKITLLYRFRWPARLFTPALAYLILSIERHPWWVILGLFTFVLLANRLYFTPQLTEYPILILRRFGQASTRNLANYLLAASRPFGRIRTLTDRDLRKFFKVKGLSYFLTRNTYIVTSNENWQAVVTSEIDRAAVVIIDATHRTAAVEWEIEFCSQLAPDKTILLTKVGDSLIMQSNRSIEAVNIHSKILIGNKLESLIAEVFSANSLSR